MLPPNAVTIPRTELPMEQLLNIHSTPGQSGISTVEDGSSNKTSEKDGSRKVSSPSRLNADEPSTAELKESEDSELLKIYDGNSSSRMNIYRVASVPKTATAEQIRDIAMRRFHISDNPEPYYVTQAPFEPNDGEEPLEDPIPLRNLKRPDGKKGQIYLRYRDDPDRAVVKVYGGWLRIPVTFTEISVTKETLVQDVLAQALEDFGLERSTWNKYHLIEVSLERGVAERTANPQENMLQLVRNLRKVSGLETKKVMISKLQPVFNFLFLLCKNCSVVKISFTMHFNLGSNLNKTGFQ